MKRRTWVTGAAAAAGSVAWPLAAAAPAAGAGPKVLRIAFNSAETGFDPAQTSDIYSRAVTGHIFEALYRYDHLARPVRIRPNTAAALPEVGDDFRTWTIRLQPGIRFQDDAAFGGQPRELVADDYVFSFKRFVDPALKSSAAPEILNLGILGLADLRKAALERRQAFDYRSAIDGLRALDRHTLQIRLAEPRPQLLELLANNGQMGALAREVVERYRDDLMAHPVGTGPFRLARWRRSSQIVLERNPQYRERFYDEQPAADDAPGQAIAARLKGRRIPLVDRVEIAVIEEAQPRWLAFLGGKLDLLAIPGEFLPQAVVGGTLAPHLAKRGIGLSRVLNPDIVYCYLDMRDPVFGGMSPERVALRRAVSLAIDVPRLIARLYRGQAVVAQSTLPPGTSGYDPAFKSEMGDHDPARAKALLEIHGYVDRDGDGIREDASGRPLVLTMGSQPDQFSRGFNELMLKDLAAVGIRLQFSTAQWAENLKAARAGKLQMWMLSGNAAQPDGSDFLAQYYSRQVGGQNFARFELPAFDRLYERLLLIPDGPEREAVFRQAKRLSVAYMPYKALLHRIITELSQPWVVGYRRPLFWRDWYAYVDVTDERP